MLKSNGDAMSFNRKSVNRKYAHGMRGENAARCGDDEGYIPRVVEGVTPPRVFGSE